MTSEGEKKPDFSGRIGRKASLVLATLFALLLIGGGVSILLTKSILEGTDEIGRLSEDIKRIDRIHFTAHHLVDAISYAMIRGAQYPGEDFSEVISNLGSQVEDYLKAKPAREVSQGDLPGKEQELEIFRELMEMASNLTRVAGGIFSSITQGARPKPEDLENLMGLIYRVHAKAEQLTQIHQAQIRRLIQMNSERMRLILIFYLTFLLIGSLLIVVGSLAFSRAIVSPLRKLATATHEIASGRFDKRVPVSSKDEIGQLSYSFNVMAERLAEHEAELRSLNEKAQSLAIMEERERIAREMHDGLAQTMGSLHLRITRAQELLDMDGTARAKAFLEETRKMAEGAYEDVRQSIFGLRTMVSRSLGLVPTLTEYLHEWSVQTGIPVDLQIRDERATHLTPEAEVQLIRIIQEALTNVRKHAGAAHAWVRFEMEGDRALVTVADEGKGFDMALPPKRAGRSFGLESMQERAQSIGGSLEVQSLPGKGTSIIARLPIVDKGDYKWKP